jgi:bacterioferritin-associated ferredoxin
MNDLPEANTGLLTIIRIRVHNTHMIVCVCKAVSDRHIRAAVKDGATRLQEISRRTGLGTCCGKCLPEAKLAMSGCLAGEDLRPSFFPAPVEAAA